MYEKGEVVIDKISPQGRFSDLIDNDTLLYSMSLGKSVASYLMGHAICKGYIESVDQKLSDWPIVENSLIAEATVRDVINASMGHQKYMSDSETFKKNRTNVNSYSIETLVKFELAGSKPSRKRFEYGQLPANVALNYIDFKTGHQFKSFMDQVFREIPKSAQTDVILSPSRRRATNLRRSSIRLHSFQGIWVPPQMQKCVTYVSGIICYLCVGKVTATAELAAIRIDGSIGILTWLMAVCR